VLDISFHFLPGFCVGLAIILAVGLRLYNSQSVVGYSNVQRLSKMKLSLYYYIPYIMIALAVACLIIASAQPHMGTIVYRERLKGLEIALALDLSGSMGHVTNGGRPSRLEQALDASRAFVHSREETEDRLAVIAYSTKAYIFCPLTSEHETIIKFMDRLQGNPLSKITAIGRALKVSLATVTSLTLGEIEEAIENPKALEPEKGKVIIVFTDGRHNSGIHPNEVLPVAKTLGVKVYFVSTEPDSKNLSKAIKDTGGQYVHIDRVENLQQTFLGISKQEKAIMIEESDVVERNITSYFLGCAMLLLVVAVVIQEEFFLTIP